MPDARRPDRSFLPAALAPMVFAVSLPAIAQTAASPPALAVCAALADDRARLECYDRAAGRGAPAAAVPPAPLAPAPALDPVAKQVRDERRALGSTLGERWELDPDTKQGRFVLRPYKPMYVLPVRWSSSVNQEPVSSGIGNSVSQPLGLSEVEAAFQISMKAKIWETIGGTNLDLWLGYTQNSHWQVYSASKPFRETNYEPEVFGIWGIDQPLYAGWNARFLGLGLTHQSNGRAEPLSRSWNRIIAQAGFENGPWSVIVRPWWRLPESPDVDDNPGIENYLGRGELVVTRRLGAQQVTVQLRHSLRGGDQARGSVLIDWAYPLSSYLKGHLQVFSGYGETMIDFNHRQTTVGVGFSLVEWQ
ncbi:MAG: phospholipase A [Burkholderiaceae bacterium]